MAWGWKLAGAVVGGLLGGPVGVGIGMAVGHGLDNIDNQPTGQNREDDAEGLLQAVLVPLLSIAKADGEITPRENRLIKELLSTINQSFDEELSEYELDVLIEKTANDDLAIRTVLEVVVEVTKSNHDLAQSLLKACWRVGAADLDINAAELNWLMGFSEAIGLSEDDFMIYALIYYRPANDATSHEQALSMLGLPNDAGLEQIKTAYRKLSQKYHPDKHSHLAPEIKELAAHKFSEITEAYKLLTTPTPWYGKLASSYTVEQVSEYEIVSCLICEQKNRLPSSEHYHAVRCGKCQALLLHNKEVAEMLSAD